MIRVFLLKDAADRALVERGQKQGLALQLCENMQSSDSSVPSSASSWIHSCLASSTIWIGSGSPVTLVTEVL
ncbi:hypothetical protein KOW79_013916 [Hemibagrus wyckioides]|uniref:Uncharacterized protein n=1 Tax=Hemibagrus wyckioides TaxID=337641 RepID=A0A9D3NI72_9TELE|nr:hypothetical protein KOW79_013916 [Hemibagrus wyckioides]